MKFQKKTHDRIIWMKKEIAAGTPRSVIRAKFLEKFRVHVTNFYDIYSLAFSGEMTARMAKPAKNRKQKASHIGSKNKCYFGGGGELLEHHISYEPEITVTLSRTNHAKLHALVKEYHSQILKKDEDIRRFKTKLDNIKRII